MRFNASVNAVALVETLQYVSGEEGAQSVLPADAIALRSAGSAPVMPMVKVFTPALAKASDATPVSVPVSRAHSVGAPSVMRTTAHFSSGWFASNTRQKFTA